MNQDNNQLNQTFNNHGNNSIQNNNQPLQNNQSLENVKLQQSLINSEMKQQTLDQMNAIGQQNIDFNQETDDNQQQSTQNYQQQNNLFETKNFNEQLMNNNNKPQNINNQFSKNGKIGIIIGIIVIIVIAIIIGVFLLSNNKKTDTPDSDIIENNGVNIETNHKDTDTETTNKKDKEYILKNTYDITDNWKDVTIIIDGQTYIVGKSQLKEFINNGWESNYVVNQVNNGTTNSIKSNGDALVTIGNEIYGNIITVSIKNNTSTEQKIEDCVLETIIINLSSLNNELYPDIVIAGNISFNNTLQEAIDKHGKASELIDKGDSYYSVYWYDTNSAFSYSKSMGFLIKENDIDGILSSRILEIYIESK